MNIAVRVAAVLGFFGVALGAFGAHGLKDTLTAHNTLAIWQTAVLYHLVHAVAALWAAGRNPVVVWIWTVGILIFSGSLYYIAVSGITWWGRITPIGGLFLLAGWLVIVIRPK